MHPAVTSSWYATAEDLAEVTEKLKRAHSTLAVAVEAFPVRNWESAAPDGGWSAGQIVEHIFLAQQVLREEVHLHLQDVARPELLSIMDKQRSRLQMYLPGGGKAQAGKRSTAFRGLRPEGTMVEIASAEQAFSSLLRTAEAYPIKVIAWESPFFGELSAFLWLLYPALHTARHVDQLSRLNVSLQRLTPFKD